MGNTHFIKSFYILHFVPQSNHWLRTKKLRLANGIWTVKANDF